MIKQIDMLGDHEIKKNSSSISKLLAQERKLRDVVFFNQSQKLYFIWIKIEKHIFNLLYCRFFYRKVGRRQKGRQDVEREVGVRKGGRSQKGRQIGGRKGGRYEVEREVGGRRQKGRQELEREVGGRKGGRRQKRRQEVEREVGGRWQKGRQVVKWE